MSKTKSGWPVSVPVLEGKDFCRGKYYDGHGHRCLYGWSIAVFGDDTEQDKKVCKVIEDIINVGQPTNSINIVDYNDEMNTPRHKLAQVWNKAMATLGYKVGNPEAK